MAMESYAETSPIHRMVRRSVGSWPIARIYRVIQQPTDRLVYRLSGGRTTASSWTAGVRITMLTTTGARSGKPRTVPVLGFREGDDVVLIASNFGRPHHPAWYHNLRAHPRASVTFDGEDRDRAIEVEARELEGEEYDRYFERGAEISPAFHHYRRWCGDRRIPVLRLEATDR
jgi:deazaflavin-dependent oxidoreductase (nitroreductase family)